MQHAAEALVVPEPRIAPRLPVMDAEDLDGDRIQDTLQAELARAHASGQDSREPLAVELVFDRPVTVAQQRAFESAGGRIVHMYRAVAYGFSGSLPRGAMPDMARALGRSLIAITGDDALSAQLDQATRNGRVRPIWASGFAGSAAGYVGTSDITIAIVDSGVDATHTDLAGRMAYFHDYSPDAEPSARDVAGHGTFVAGIALGSGAAAGLGGGALTYTQSGDESAIGGQGEIYPAYFGAGTSTIAMHAQWLGGGSATLMWLGGTYGASPATFSLVGAPVSGSSALDWSQSVSFSSHKFSAYLQPMSVGSVTRYAVSVAIANYPAATDLAPVLRGVCPACRWAGLKVFSNAFVGSSLALAAALDDAAALADTHSIKVLSMSIGTSVANSALLAKVESVVQNGIVVVVAIGNAGPSGAIGGVARATSALTVGASNDDNALTEYTSLGVAAGSGQTMKPDLLAPGGSVYGSSILSTDTNEGDGATTDLNDLVANDYTPSHGTSAAAPFAAGAAALLIDALQQHGLTWSWDSNALPLRIKTLLCATATETGAAREGGVQSPVLGRDASPKDTSEGYGILNPDAAIEAATLPFNGTLVGSSPGGRDDRRAWARSVELSAGTTVSATLSMDAALDVDVYLYRATPDALTEPVILAASAHAGGGVAEALEYTSSSDQSGFLVVKRVLGSGAFSLSGSSRVCGDGVLDSGEECDDSNRRDGDCCSSACELESDGSDCQSPDLCMLGQTCSAGSCAGGTPKLCSASDDCHLPGSCDPDTGACSDPEQSDGHGCDDDNACTLGDHCQQGACIGASSVTCSTDELCQQSSCNPGTGQCQLSNLSDGTACDDGDLCLTDQRCEGGACTGTPRICIPADDCHEVVSCSSSRGCVFAALDDTACDDGDACTQADRCNHGHCSGEQVSCPSADPCLIGACNADSGACETSPRPDGTACDDGNACTRTDQCQAGHCTPREVASCHPSDSCHLAGTCDPSTGSCSNPERPDAGSECNHSTATAGADASASPTEAGAPAGDDPNPGHATRAAASNSKSGCSVLATNDPLASWSPWLATWLVAARRTRRARRT